MPNWNIAVALAIAALMAACKSAPPPAAPPPDPAPPVATASEPQRPRVAAPEAAAQPTVSAAMTASVTGNVTYKQRKALPPEALIKVQLLEFTAPEAPARVLSQQIIEAKGRQVPFAYKVAYDPKAIIASNRYQVSAVITVNDQVWFASDTAIRAITGGNPKRRDILVKPALRP